MRNLLAMAGGIFGSFLLLAASVAEGGQPETGRIERKAEAFKSSYLLQVPENYTKEREWPLLIALHGAGGKAENFIEIWAGTTPRRGYLLAVPRGDVETPCRCGKCGGMVRNWSWNSGKYIFWIIEDIRKTYRVQRDRIYLNGFSAGASVTFHVGLRHPDRFAAIIPCAGVSRGGTAEMLKAAKTLPILGLVGKQDPARMMMKRSMDRLKALNFSDVTFIEVEDLAHYFPAGEVGAILDWCDERYKARKALAKALAGILEKGKKAFGEKRFAEAVPLLSRIAKEGVTAARVAEAEALLAKADAVGKERLWTVREKVLGGDMEGALRALRKIQTDFPGLSCAREAAKEEKKLLEKSARDGEEEGF
ncbi:MAG: carboxylesterase family protein [Planctomycetota bacterium]|jgi:poly(3-hydroxybutyrate) depolymerase